MRKILFIFLIPGCMSLHAQKSKSEVLKSLESKSNQYSEVAKKIWAYAEVGYQEDQSSALLQKTLVDAGFHVQSNVAGMPTAFTATFGSGKPVIGILGEFDALPGISQEAVPE